ncbi:hypothetical protein [Amycolatopsis sp. NPDC049868]|uniref:hypothetical protein n=1 Tax=Amycolatopsis sp. NPDC049868 TaxID=3363934 RepID=UPI0037B72F9E
MKELLSRNLRRAATAIVVASAATPAFTGTASAATGAVIDPTLYRWNESGCGTTSYWSNLKHNSGTKLSRVRVVVCVDDAGWDTCYRSGWQQPRGVDGR